MVLMSNAFLSCDWGTSSFRLRLVRIGDGEVLAETTDGKGIAAINNEWVNSGKASVERVPFYQQQLSSAIAALRTATAGLPIIISGMASSSIGMLELSYGSIPWSLSEGSLPINKIPAIDGFPHEVILVSGLKTANDVMRGEETMLLGCDLQNKQELLVIFPGTHSKHAIINKGSLIDFRTYMTGEVFDLLATKSILTRSVSPGEVEARSNAFSNGVKEGMEGNLLNSVFHVRTRQLLANSKPAENYHYLSGLAIGYELSDILQNRKNILLVCSTKLGELYKQALEIITGKTPEYRDADKSLMEGHRKLAAKIL
jgi:2-dehydro-3-deoxygalactonokinase